MKLMKSEAVKERVVYVVEKPNPNKKIRRWMEKDNLIPSQSEWR